MPAIVQPIYNFSGHHKVAHSPLIIYCKRGHACGDGVNFCLLFFFISQFEKNFYSFIVASQDGKKYSSIFWSGIALVKQSPLYFQYNKTEGN